MGANTQRLPKNNTKGVALSFVLGDWVLGAGFYTIDLQHNLESSNISTEVFDSNDEEIEVDRIKIINTNTIRVFTVADPDCRFEGKAIIVAL